MKDSEISRLRRRKGFTLVELLLAMLLGSIVVLGINAAYRQAYSVWSSVESRRPIYHNTRLVTETLRQELSCLYFPPKPGVNEGAESEQPFKPISADGAELAFYTLAPCWKGSLASARMAKVRYTLTEDPDTGQSILQRFEQPYAGEKPIGKETSDIVVKGLSDFSVSAVGGEEGDGERENGDAPPKAIKVRLAWAETEDGSEGAFQTTILVPCEGSLEGTGGSE